MEERKFLQLVGPAVRACLALGCLAASMFMVCGCAGTDDVNQAERVWKSYVSAIKSGHASLARRFITPESQTYFTCDSLAQKTYLERSFRIVTAKQMPKYVKLDVLSESHGKQEARFYYLIKRENSYLLQSPLVLFAADWPLDTSSHFIVHEGTGPVDPRRDTLSTDPAVLETFLVKLESLTGVEVSQKINYYRCHSPEQASELTSTRDRLWASIGNNVISVQRYDFAQIAIKVMKDHVRLVDLLYYGLPGYAEFQRTQLEGTPTDVMDHSVAKYMENRPGGAIAEILDPPAGVSPELHKLAAYYVGAAMIRELVDRFGTERLRPLFKATTAAQFRDQLKRVCGLDVKSLEAQLAAKYVGTP